MPRMVRLAVSLNFTRDVQASDEVSDFEVTEQQVFALGRTDPNNPAFVDQVAIARALLAENSGFYFDSIDVDEEILADEGDDEPDDDDA